MPSTLIGCTLGPCICALRLAREINVVVNLSLAVIDACVPAEDAYNVSPDVGDAESLAINLLSCQSANHCFNAPLISFNISYCVFRSSASKRDTALRTN